MPELWVVLLEAAIDAACDPVDAEDLHRLHDVLEPDRRGGVLHSPDRYLLQITATGAGPVDALSDVVAKWTAAVRRLGLPPWKLVRTEVFTAEELEREFEKAERQAIGVHHPGDGPGPPEHDDIGHELLRRAFSDPLTGLLGGLTFAHRLEAALAGPRSRRTAAVMCLDIDGLQDVNRRFGAATGDEVLITVAQRLTATLRPGDVLARLGGDEYGVLLEDSTEHGALSVAGRVLDAVRLPMTISGEEVIVSASAGVALGQPGESAEEVVAKAEAALGAAKASAGDGPLLHGSDVSPARTRPYFAMPALQDRLAHLQLLQQATVAANEADTLHEAAQVVMRHICTQVGCAVGHLSIAPAPSAEGLPETPLWHMADGGHDPAWREATEDLLAGPGVNLARRVLAGACPVWIADLADSDDLLSPERATAARLQSAFAFPVVVGSEVVAVLSFYSRTRMEPTDSLLDVLAGTGTQLGRVVERQRAAEALRRSAERLRASEARVREAERLARLVSWHFDLRTGEGTWSEGVHTLYGLELGQPLDLDSALAAVHPDDRSRARAALARLVEAGEPLAEDVRILRSDGQVRWHRSQGWAITGDDDVVVAIHGSSQDITEAKLTQDALRERERQLHEAQRAARLGWWEHDLSTDRLTWSDELCRLWGLEPGCQVSFDEILASLDPDHRRGLLEAMDRSTHTEGPVHVDFRATVADGRQRWFRGEAHVARDAEGKPVRRFGTAQDVTEQKQAEEDLRRTKDLYQRIVETTREGILILDAHDVITFASPRMAQILGHSVDGMTGMSASSLVDEETLARLAGHQKRRREGISEHYETQLRTKDGAVVHVLVSASPFMDHGTYAGALAMVTDITAVREAEEIVRSQSLRLHTEVAEGERGEKPPAS